MKIKLFFLLFLVSLSSFAQYTLIPDVKFENKLIALGIESGVADGEVLTSKINTLTSLDVSNSNITNLTGIQDFVALTALDCEHNQLTGLDVSKNTALTYLDCSFNLLKDLDISKNTALTILYCGINQLTKLNVSNNTVLSELYCDRNQFTNLDVSKNIALTVLECFANQLTDLDVSQNTALIELQCTTNELTHLDVSKNIALKYLQCESNQLIALDVSHNTSLVDFSCSYNALTRLNLKNGNNSNFKLSINDSFRNNPNLTCIQVDDVAYSNANWATKKDAIAGYNTIGPSLLRLGIAETTFNTIAVYPNPVKGEVHIDNCVVEKATVYDALGKLVKTTSFVESSTNSIINLAGLPSGIYYIYLESDGATVVKKIIVD